MHEFGLAEAIADSVRNRTRGRSVARIKVRMGMLLRAEEDAMQQGFLEAAEGTELDGAQLELVFVPGRGVCHECGAEVEVKEPWTLCPNCQGAHIHTPEGEDMILEEIEYRAVQEAG